MRNFLVLLYFLVIFLFTPITIAQTQEKTNTPPVNSNSITNGLNNIISDSTNTQRPSIHIGVIVQSLNTGKTLYQYNADQLFTPASVQKLFTAIAALDFLKPDYQFSTELLTDGSITNGILNGNLYVKFTGDPTLKNSDLAQLFQYLRNTTGVHTITGHVYVDNFAYDNMPTPPGCVWDDLIHGFAAPMNAIIINHNQFLIQFSPANKINEPVLIKTSLPLGVGRFINEATTVSDRKPCSISIRSNGQNVFLINGCIGLGQKTQSASLAIRDVLPYALGLTQHLLKRNQIIFSGSVRPHQTPNVAQLIVNHKSAPLSVIIRKMLKDSDNVFTNSIFKKLGEQFFHPPGSWQGGYYAIKQLLSEPAQINFNQGLFIDGAGLSRYNLISPRQLSQLLIYAYSKPHIKDWLMPSLPIAGKDGTLAGRMPQEARSERVHAKTGSMTGVTALAGYLNTMNNGPLTFAIIVNGFAGSKAPYRALQDRICEYLIRAQRS